MDIKWEWIIAITSLVILIVDRLPYLFKMLSKKLPNASRILGKTSRFILKLILIAIAITLALAFLPRWLIFSIIAIEVLTWFIKKDIVEIIEKKYGDRLNIYEKQLDKVQREIDNIRFTKALK
jgi:hypothetical protein